MADDADVTPEVNGATPSDRRPPGILFWSTPESAADGRTTVLACVETVFAMSVTAYIAWRTGSLFYIAVPACVAPLLLLRTPHSTAVGLTFWGRYDAWMNRTQASMVRAQESRRYLVWSLHGLECSCLAMLGSLVALACRIAAVSTTILRHPLATFRAIPGNWRQVALATDLHHPPEIVPGIERNEVDSFFRFTGVISVIRDLLGYLSVRRISHVIVVLAVLFSSFGWVLLLGLLFVPTLLYRWSLKSTSIVYFPLLWAASKSRRGGDTAAQRHETIATDQAERLVRWYAGFVLIVLTILPAVLATPLQPIIASVQSAFSVDLVDFWLFTGQIKLWHIVRGINAVITMGLFLFADKALRRIRNGRAYSDERVHAIIGTGLFVRGFLGVYLSAKLLHVVVTSVDWSAVEWRIIPW